MEQVSDQIGRVEGDGPKWAYSQAFIRIQKVRAGGNPALLDEAMSLLDKAKEKSPSWAKIPLLIGQVFDLKKDPRRASKSYQEAIDLGEPNLYAILRVTDIFCQQQQFRDANTFLVQLEAKRLRLPPQLVKYWVSTILMRKDIREYETALEKAHTLAAAKSDDYKDALWLGQVLGEIDRNTGGANRKKVFENLVPEQERAYRQAVELNPAAPETWFYLINFLVANDKLSDAETALDKARKKFTGKAGQLALAQCLEVLKKYEQAKEQYGLVLAADPHDSHVTRTMADFLIRMPGTQSDRANDVKEVETLLNRIIDGKEIKPDKDDLLSARRIMARIVQARPGYENIERARKLIAKNLEEAPDSADDLHAKALIDARDPKQSNRLEAIRIYKELQKDQKASDVNLSNLAQLYLSNKNWPAARDLLRELAVGSSESPQYLSNYIHELLNHGETPDAEVYLQQLEDKWPNHGQTVLLNAELLMRGGKAEEALDLMKSFIDRPQAFPADRDQRIRLMALAMEDFAGACSDLSRRRTSSVISARRRTFCGNTPTITPRRPWRWWHFSLGNGGSTMPRTCLN